MNTVRILTKNHKSKKEKKKKLVRAEKYSSKKYNRINCRLGDTEEHK